MQDKDLLLQASGIQTMYFDGFGAYRKINGLLRCIGYVNESGAQLNLVISLAGAEEANRDSRRVLDGPAVQEVPIWRPKMAH